MLVDGAVIGKDLDGVRRRGRHEKRDKDGVKLGLCQC